jgi:hypothetical protein
LVVQSAENWLRHTLEFRLSRTVFVGGMGYLYEQPRQHDQRLVCVLRAKYEGALGRSFKNMRTASQQCAAKDKSNVVIEPAKYGDGDGSCAVSWIDQSEGSRGINYAVRALCTSASLPEKNQTVTIIVRTLGSDRAEMGRIYLHSAGSVFDDLKKYQRCP